MPLLSSCLTWLKNWQEMWEWSHQDPHLAQKLGLILHNQFVNPSPSGMAACLQQTHFIKLKDHESGDLLSWQYPTGVSSHSPADTSSLVWTRYMQYPNLLHEMQNYLLIPKNPWVSRRLAHLSIHQTSRIPKVERNRAENVEHFLIPNQHLHTLIFAKTVHCTFGVTFLTWRT